MITSDQLQNKMITGYATRPADFMTLRRRINEANLALIELMQRWRIQIDEGNVKDGMRVAHLSLFFAAITRSKYLQREALDHATNDFKQLHDALYHWEKVIAITNDEHQAAGIYGGKLRIDHMRAFLAKILDDKDVVHAITCDYQMQLANEFPRVSRSTN
jgi:hypothetical protein